MTRDRSLPNSKHQLLNCRSGGKCQDQRASKVDLVNFTTSVVILKVKNKPLSYPGAEVKSSLVNFTPKKRMQSLEAHSVKMVFLKKNKYIFLKWFRLFFSFFLEGYIMHNGHPLLFFFLNNNFNSSMRRSHYPTAC